MVVARSLSAAAARANADADQRIILSGVTWTEYEVMLAVRGERAGVRMYYLDGDLELMSPSRRHEWLKTAFARMVEAYADAEEIVLEGYGSMTMRSAPKARGAEPDECYILGPTPKETADIAIEVIWTSGGLSKLDIYRGLGVREVWLWRGGAIEVHELGSGVYAQIAASKLLPRLDLSLVAACLERDTQTGAVRAFREALGKPRASPAIRGRRSSRRRSR